MESLAREIGPSEPTAPFEQLLEQGRIELSEERLEQALSTFAEAERLAESEGSSTAADRAWLNQCAVLIGMQRVDDLNASVLQRMRSILTAAADPLTSWLAAYDISQIYELKKDYRKGLFYAKITVNRAKLLGRADRIASSYNQLGNLLLAQSCFDEAHEALEQAREQLPADGGPVRRSSILGNLGYIEVVQGNHRRGFELLHSSLRILRRAGRRREQAFAHLDLCFAHLEVGRLRHALRHGVRALALAEEHQESVSIQYALFFLGETAQLLGDSETARRHFVHLQEKYFPENPQLPDLLLTVGVRGLVNLKA